jgi:type IV fimbrial biogenesis protein FimT
MKRHSGFTLIELMVVLTLAGVLVGLAVPSFREFTASQRVKTAASDLAAAMLMARSEAVKRNTSVTVTQAAGGWTNGWTVAAGGTTLVNKESTGNVTVTPNPDPTTTSVAFQATGRASTTVRFQLETANTAAVRCVAISPIGVPNTSARTCPTSP